MIDSMQIVYVCDHVAQDITDTFDAVEVVRTTPGDIDNVCPGFTIKNIYSVYVEDSETKKKTYYFENIDFNIAGADKIRWLSPTRIPDAGKTYFVEMIKSKKTVIQYKLENCTKCNGNGWYVDVINKTGVSMFKVSGVDRITQDFIKLLLTSIEDGSEDLFSFLGKENYPDTSDRIQAYIKRCEDSYLQRQTAIAQNSTDIEDDDILKRVMIEDIEFNKELGGFFISIVLITESGESVQVGLKV